MFPFRYVQIHSLFRRLCHWPWRRCFTSTHLCYSTFWINIFTKTPNFTFPRSWLIFNLCYYFFLFFVFVWNRMYDWLYASTNFIYWKFQFFYSFSSFFFCVMVMHSRSIPRNDRHGTCGPSLRSFLRCCITQRGGWSCRSTVWTASWIAQGGCILGIRTLHPANFSLI